MERVGGGGVGGMLSGIPAWQGLSLCAILGWIVVSSALDLTRRVRSLVQPWVSRRVASDTHLILAIQSVHHVFLDTLFSAICCVVSVPFYTSFLPILFWSGHSKLARQMTLLIAFCDYVGNAIKDLVSAPRPSYPPVRRITATKDEKENAMEYGLPSSHVLNTVCLSGYFLHYVITNSLQKDATTYSVGFALIFLLPALIALGRIYLGMHSLIDVLAGISIGIIILSFWLTVHGYVDNFIILGQNVTSFWAGLSFLLCFAYPTPELPTPSYEYHAAFNGVAFGVVSGIQQTYLHFHHEDVPRILGPELTFGVFIGRILIGLPTILIVKFCSKALAKWSLPVLCNTLGIPIRSSCYVPGLKGLESNKNKPENRQSNYLQKLLAFWPQESYDVDTGIRFLQYAGLAWSVVDLVPSLFSYLRL
uniref:Dihydrosphingosine 1-phosphate phosphatase LCB3 n=1 Tax=Anthurium amnicola TaxID=1678845 RepID=A0A1D1YFY5_9ARAE